MLDEDRPMLTAMVTDCLIDAKPIDGEFRIVRPDGGVRTVHMMGEPVLDTDGSTAAMWAVLRDVSELRRSQRTVSESRESLQLHRHHAQSERRSRSSCRRPSCRPGAAPCASRSGAPRPWTSPPAICPPRTAR